MYSTSHLTRRDLDIKKKVKNLSTLADLLVAITTTSTWTAARTRMTSQRKVRKGERNDKDLRIAQSVRRASTRYSTAEPVTYFPLKYMKIRPLISLIRQDLSYLVIRVAYLHMPLLNIQC
jgi:hypothetical protein